MQILSLHISTADVCLSKALNPQMLHWSIRGQQISLPSCTGCDVSNCASRTFWENRTALSVKVSGVKKRGVKHKQGYNSLDCALEQFSTLCTYHERITSLWWLNHLLVRSAQNKTESLSLQPSWDALKVVASESFKSHVSATIQDYHSLVSIYQRLYSWKCTTWNEL